MTSDLGNRLKNSHSVYDVASFVVKFAEEWFAQFAEDISKVFPTAKIGAKTNVLRIAQKIEELMVEYNVPSSKAWWYLTDILRLTVICRTPQEVDQFKTLVFMKNSIRLPILRFKPRFDTPLKDMSINFAWQNIAICELQVKLGEVPAGYYDQHFIYECRRTVKQKDFGLFFDNLVRRINMLRSHGRVKPFEFTPPDFSMFEKMGEFLGPFKDHDPEIEKILAPRDAEKNWVLDADRNMWRGSFRKGTNAPMGMM